MFITYILAAFTLSAALGKEPPVLISGHFTQVDCQKQQSVIQSELLKDDATKQVAVVCLKIEHQEI